MSVAEQLDLKTDSALFEHAASAWREWTAERPGLVAVATLADLRPWLLRCSPESADHALHDLAWLASPRGGDSIPASAVLAWVLLPGACSLARRLSSLTPRIDAAVAAQLWLEVRSYAWERRRKVAANILADTRAGVLRDCGVPGQVARVDRAWSHAEPRGELIEFYPNTGVAQDTAAELQEVLDWACSTDVISRADRALLMHLAAAADQHSGVRSGRGQGGLMANAVSAVAADWNLSAVTVRRHARRALSHLSAACATDRSAA